MVKKKKIQESGIGYKIFSFFNILIMLLVIVVTVYPYLHELAKSLNEGSDTMLGGLTLFPRKFTLDNFAVLMKDKGIYGSFGITIMRVLIGTFFGLIIQFSAAYALSKKRLMGRNKILVFLALPMFFSGGVIPTYLLYSSIGLLNNFMVYVLPFLFNFFNMLIIRTYISTTIPQSIEEAAKIDGASVFKTTFQIVFPLCKPILATIALWIAVFHWNDWTTTLMYVTKSPLFTAQYKLMELIKESEKIQKLIAEATITGQNQGLQLKSTPESLVSAQLIITTIPIIMVYPFLQKYFVQGIMLGSIKE